MADETKTKKKKYNPNLKGLAPNITGFLKDFKALLMSKYGIDIEDVLTSAKREGSGTSQHLTGSAIDLSIKNPIIFKMLNNTEDGLNLLKKYKLGVLDESTQEKRTAAGSKSKDPHLHLAQGNSINANRHYNKTIKRLDTLKKDKSFISHDDIKKSEPSYVDNDKIKSQLQEDNLTDHQKDMRARRKKIQEKKLIFDATGLAYKDAIAKGNKEEISKTHKAHEDAYVDIYNDVSKTLRTSQLNRYNELKKTLNDYLPSSDVYRKAKKESDKIEEQLFLPKPFYKDKKKMKPFSFNEKELRKARGKSTTYKRGFYGNTVPLQNKFDDKSLLKDIEDLETNYFPINTGKDIDWNEKDSIEKLIEEKEKREEEQSVINKQIENTTPETPEEKEKKKKEKEEEKGLTPGEIAVKKAAEEAKRIQAERIETKRVEEEATKSKRLKTEADGFMSRFNEPVEALRPPNVFDYDKKNYKRDIPVEALGLGALGLMGLNDTKEELPLRDEQVSQAVLQYTAQLKRLSEQGLKPEEEAKMKADLAGAYSSGISQITRASGGNRNLVLGNLPKLNNTRMDSIADMNLSDVAIKQQNFYKFGDAIEKTQAFNKERKVANHSIKLNEAKTKRAGGAALASQSFAAMLEEFQYQKENGPGSANHRQMKAFEIMLTGVDSELEDPGDGSRPNTFSWQMKNYEEGVAANEKSKNTYDTEQGYVDKFHRLSPSEQAKYDNYLDYRNELIEDNQPEIQTKKKSQNIGGYSSFGHNSFKKINNR